MKVGLSLSFCIQDIMNGKVREDEVKFISAGTECTTRKDWDGCIASYKKNYWEKYPDQAEALFRRLIDQGLIIQPRLEGMKPAPLCTEKGLRHWVEEEEYNELLKSGQ